MKQKGFDTRGMVVKSADWQASDLVAVCLPGNGSEQKPLCIFFFQAEDGIRDLTVTGVQTCALPISHARSRRVARNVRRNPVSRPAAGGGDDGADEGRGTRLAALADRVPPWAGRRSEIGRASCRERV